MIGDRRQSGVVVATIVLFLVAAGVALLAILFLAGMIEASTDNLIADGLV